MHSHLVMSRSLHLFSMLLPAASQHGACLFSHGLLCNVCTQPSCTVAGPQSHNLTCVSVYRLLPHLLDQSGGHSSVGAHGGDHCLHHQEGSLLHHWNTGELHCGCGLDKRRPCSPGSLASRLLMPRCLACFDALSRKQGSCHSLAEAAHMMCCTASITLHCCCP